MALQLFSNNAETTLSSALANGATTINVTSGQGGEFPSPTGGDYAILTLYEKDINGNVENVENVKLTARTSDALTVVRDHEGIVGVAGGFSYPTVPGRTVYIAMRWSAAGASNMVQTGHIGVLVQAWNAALDWVAANITDAGKALLNAANAAAQRTVLGLGGAATKDVGTGAAQVAAGDHLHGGVYEPVGTVASHTSAGDPHGQYALEAALGTAAVKNTGTSGNTIPLLDAANTWGSLQTFTTGINSCGPGNDSTNVAISPTALGARTTGLENVAVGASALNNSTTGGSSTAVGYSALSGQTTGSNNTAVGRGALSGASTSSGGVAVGYGALAGAVTTNYNVAVGYGAASSLTSGTLCVAIGYYAMRYATNAPNNAAVGAMALYNTTSGGNNTALGYYAGTGNTSGSENVFVGATAGVSNTTGYMNVALGASALGSVAADNNTAIGASALLLDQSFNAHTYSNCAGIGSSARVSGNNQVQLGSSATTTYVYGTVQNRSDLRDKADVRDTVLGLKFINALRPVDYRWDMRDDYMRMNGDKVVRLPKDGSKKRSRFHHGLIAQEVEAVIAATGIDFGGYQAHDKSGGNDVKTIGYDELIAPLIKAVQELSAKVAALESRG